METLFISEIYKLKREIYWLRENVNKSDQDTEDNNLYQKYKIKNYYLHRQNSLLKQKWTIKRKTINKSLEFSSSEYKDINYSNERGQKTIYIANKDTGCEFKCSDVPHTNCNLVELPVNFTVDSNKWR